MGGNVSAKVDLSHILEATVWQWLALAVLLALLIGMIMWIKSIWSDDDDPAQAEHEMLTQITELQRRGDLTSEEYRSIKGRLSARLHEHSLPTENTTSHLTSNVEGEADSTEL